MKLLVGRAGSGKTRKVIEICNVHTSKGKTVMLVTDYYMSDEDVIKTYEVGKNGTEVYVSRVHDMGAVLNTILECTEDVLIFDNDLCSRNLRLMQDISRHTTSEVYCTAQANAQGHVTQPGLLVFEVQI